MRKTSQDGGDSTSIMSGVENEIKKPSAAVIKNKRNSIKRKVQTLSHESDDAVSEPLLQKEKEKTETVNQSAKFSILKSKTDALHNRDSDKDKLLTDNKTKTSGLQEMSLSSNTKENILFKSHPTTTVTLHNHMNTNVFSSIDTTKFITATKNQILVEIDGCKQVGYNPSPLIFTTAKIHTDSKTKQMEPVQVTAVPILSTTEITKTGKPSNSTGVVQVIPGSSDIKVTDKPQKVDSISSNISTAETNSKYNGSKAINENTLADCPVKSSQLSKDSTKLSAIAVDTKDCKSMVNKFKNKLSESHDPSKTEEVQKTNYLTKKIQSPLSDYKDIKTVNTVNVLKSPSTVSDIITGISRKPKTEDSITTFEKAAGIKKDTFKQEEVKIDEKTNTNTVTLQQPVKSSVSGSKKSDVDSKQNTDIIAKDNISKDLTSLTGNKQLPRQKNAIVEETGDITSKSKTSGSNNSSYSNNSKYSKDIDVAPIKSTTHSKMSERGASDVSIKTLPNSSANNFIDIMTTKITATSIVSKPTSSFTSTIKSTVADTTTTASVTTTTKPISTKIPSINANTKTSIMPLTTSATISNKSQTTTSSLSSVAPSTSDNKFVSSTIKLSDINAVAQSSASIKLGAASSLKSANVNVSLMSTENVSTTNSNFSSPSSITLKSPIVKSNSTSISSTSSTKPINTNSSAKSSTSSKKNGPKTNEVNKDSKGLKT